MRPEPIPDLARSVVDRYLDLADHHLPERLVGLYLVGSIALGDFAPGRSDVDFVAVLDDPASDATIDALETVHAAVDAFGDLPKLDGFYVSHSAFAGEPESANPVAFHVDNRFVGSGECFELNPVTWATLSRHGVAVRGAPATSLGISVTHERLARWCAANLRSYWTGYAARTRDLIAAVEPGSDIPAELIGDLLAWAVTGPPRLHHTIVTGEIASKSGATRWALDVYADGWHDLLEAALRVTRHDLSAATVAAALRVPDFVDWVVDAACAAAPA